jgi:hypothetical protein
MARENSARRNPGVPDIREAIIAAVTAHGAGKILPSEMVIELRTNPDYVRYAPKYSTGPDSGPVSLHHPYTVDALATFLVFVKSSTQKPTNSFEAVFGAEELRADKVLTESQIKGLSAERLGELVISVRKQRDAAKAETARLAAEAKKRADEAIARAAELAKQKAEAETRRLAAIETERLAAIKRAEEKAKRDAEEKVRLAAEAFAK